MSGEIESVLGYSFGQEHLLREALTHSTYANEHPTQGDHNERLEFLGDAVVGLLVANLLFHDLDAEEGHMTKQRARVVRREGLASLARKIDLGEHLLLGEGQRRSGGADSDRLLADAFEALVGAVFVDGGWPAVRDTFVPMFEDALSQSRQPLDFKTALQERAHAAGEVTPEYRVVTVSGPDHAREYEVEVRVGTRVLGTGSGTSKKAAEQVAAEHALEHYP
ncbi:MAG: ribonuclease III [Myxococcota bacterium]